ncbi:MAG TPA: Fur family transcriptional regulator [Usitatibacteraceae bacterium]|nr:Fur family transcriptional regulator [Usitatibacteraceae bacterium]
MGKSRTHYAAHLPAAQVRIRAAGERLTAPRAAVLAALLGSEAALTHHELEGALRADLAVDRVTVYRVLDWLVAVGLAHRIPGEDRTWRFHANRDRSHGPHAHFTCSRCGKTVCLEDVAVPPRVRLPRGFLPQRVELTVQGLCAACH